MYEFTGQPLRHWWPVTAKVPSTDKPGEVSDQKFEVLFENLGHDEAVALDEELNLAEARRDTSKRSKLLLRVVKDWKGVVDGEKKEIPFSEATLKALLQLAWVRIGLNKAWVAYQNGNPSLGN